jgi:hypothetical protein
MIAMTRTPRVRLVLALLTLLGLLVVPMAGARTPGLPSVQPTTDGWLDVAARWLTAHLNPRLQGHHGPSHAKSPGNAKDGTSQPNGGGCINPVGHPPICF